MHMRRMGLEQTPMRNLRTFLARHKQRRQGEEGVLGTMNTDSRPHALYRFYSRTGKLLYVGLTADPPTRFREHSAVKPWWTAVARITLEMHPDRASVAAAELKVIRTEHPLHNIAGKRPRTTQRLPAPTRPKPIPPRPKPVTVLIPRPEPESWPCWFCSAGVVLDESAKFLYGCELICADCITRLELRRLLGPNIDPAWYLLWSRGWRSEQPERRNVEWWKQDDPTTRGRLAEVLPAVLREVS